MKINQKTYAIISVSELDLIDFSEIDETSKDTIRINNEQTQFVIKWEGKPPSFISDESVIPLQILSHSKCIILMNTSDWSEEEEEEIKEEAKK